MAEFRLFVESHKSEKNDDLHQTIERLPKAHQDLLKDYKFKFQGGNTLKGDEGHIGSNDLDKKVIVVAAPYYYSREFCILHEVAHLVYDRLVKGKDIEKKWNALCKKTDDRVNQSCEEVFCHSYATAYTKHKVARHNHPALIKFILHQVPK